MSLEVPSIVAITGPTGSGKTDLAIRLAGELHGEIINADSVQVYRGFRIGAGAPTEAELATVPHHLFGVCDGTEEWNAGVFRERAAACIGAIVAGGKLPILCGGTGLYIRALLSGLVDIPSGEDARSVRESIRQLRTEGRTNREIGAELHRRLLEHDPGSAAAIPAHDLQRTARALEVALSTGGSLVELQRAHGHRELPYRALVICLFPPREALYSRIDQRVNEMIAAGFLDEVRQLVRSLPADAKPLQSIGYKEAVRFLAGEGTDDQFRAAMAQSTRRFAKRQFTWWRHQPQKLGWRTLDRCGSPEIPDMIREVQAFLAEKNSVREVLFFPIQV